MGKGIIGLVLISIAGGSWLYLDYLNKQETIAVVEMRKEMQLSHERSVANMKELGEMRSRIELSMVSDLTGCFTAAEKTSFDYISHFQESARPKLDQIIISNTELVKVAMKLESDKAECQKSYDLRAKNLLS